MRPDREPPRLECFRARRVSAEEIAEEFGVSFSTCGCELTGVNARQAEYIQTYPLLNGPDTLMNKRLWAKLSTGEAWRIYDREPEDFFVEIHRTECLPPFPTDWRVPGQSQEILRRSYAVAVWGIQRVPRGPVTILQAGSMRGHEPALMRSLDPQREIFAIDLLFECATQVRRAGFSISVGSLTALPFASESFDCVYNNNVMEHVYDVETALREVHRVLRPRGMFSFVIPLEGNPSNPDLQYQLSNVGKSCNWWLVDPGHPWKTDLHDVSFRLRQTGFREVRFAFREEDLLRYKASVAKKPPWRFATGMQRLWMRFEESLAWQNFEGRVRAALGFYRWLGYRLRMRSWLGLSDRHAETLQVLISAEKCQ